MTFLRNKQEPFEELYERLTQVVADNHLVGFVAVVPEPVQDEPVLTEIRQ